MRATWQVPPPARFDVATGDLPGHLAAELASMPIFLGAGPHDLTALAERFRRRRLRAGQPVFDHRVAMDSFAVVLTGTLAVTPAQRAGVDAYLLAARGSVLGEVAMLRGEDTVGYATAATDATVAVGDFETFVAMLEIPAVHERVQLVIDSRLRRDARPVVASLDEHRRVIIRPLLPTDRAPFALAFKELSRASIAQRFFTQKSPSSRVIDYLVNIDYIDHFAYVIIDQVSGEGMGVARYIRSHEDPRTAEIALTVVDRYHGLGVGTALLAALAVPATAAGIATFTASILSDNRSIRAVLRKADARFEFAASGTTDATLTVAAARSLLDRELDDMLEAATRELLVAVGTVLATRDREA